MKPANYILLALVVGVSFCGCGKKESPAQPTNAPSSTGNPLTAPVDYIGAAAKAQQRSIKTIDLASLTQAIQLFNAQEERFPATLNELVTKGYLRQVPPPPQGMKFNYDPKTGEVKIVPQ